MRNGHPLLSSDHFDVADSILKYPRAVMLFPDGRQLLHDDIIAELANEGLPPASFASPFFMSLGPAIAASNMVACIPERAARHIASGNELSCVAAPAATGFTYRLIWHERTNHDPEQKWLRFELQTLISK